ncbi:MAG TPA: fibrobacter succinogenes major paralogous domain-containing protein, partial [Cyclobacteriaceae bacterium]|nr:fibrobacter succinogenes major paralogous domain-containing protein [Cyclobacteriaceae bacterium]
MVLLFSCGGAGEKTVMIGEQTWMVKNLDVSTFRNGDTIPEAKTAEEWIKAGQEGRPAWSYFYNDTENSKKYGKLYNWYAVSDPRTLAPQGWHIPGNDEWLMLSKALIENVGAKMKSRSGWENKGNGTNESGFTGLPGGWRDSAGEFRDIGYIGAWWSSSEIDALNATYWDVTENESQFYNSNTIKTEGHYIRCVSGETVSSVAETDQAEIVESEGETLNIKSAKIGSQVWMSENLDVSRFRNGDEIPELENGDEWESAGRESRPAWCYYNNDPEYGKKFGKLYNWHAVNDPRGLAPEGWHIPTNDEWAELNDYLGDYAGFKMKSVSDWKVSVNESEHVGNGDNSSGFNGLPGGKRGFASHHGFTYSGEFGYWWS